MYNKKLIERICNLTCKPEDVSVVQTSIRYDKRHPFRKYYNVNSIITAINKYLNKEWDDKTLAHWCCIYDWILYGGFKKGVIEDLNSLEKLIRDVICYYLDGISFFEDDLLTEVPNYFVDAIEGFKNLDFVLKTLNDWKCFYAKIGIYCEYNDDQYVVLFNETEKKYIIIHSDHLQNGFNDKYIRYIDEDKFIALIEQLKEEGFEVMKYDEYWYEQALSYEEEQ